MRKARISVCDGEQGARYPMSTHAHTHTQACGGVLGIKRLLVPKETVSGVKTNLVISIIKGRDYCKRKCLAVHVIVEIIPCVCVLTNCL